MRNGKKVKPGQHYLKETQSSATRKKMSSPGRNYSGLVAMDSGLQRKKSMGFLLDKKFDETSTSMERSQKQN